jgi:DNA-directed RNA polymerase specialized sigma24 family protein
VIDVGLLAFEPRWLRFLVGIAALVDDARDLVAEVLLDLLQRRGPAGVFNRVWCFSSAYTSAFEN